MPLPERKKFDPGLPPVQAVPEPATPQPEPSSLTSEPAAKPKASKPKARPVNTAVPAGPDPHLVRRERRDPDVDLVQFGTRINSSLRRRVRDHSRRYDETITDLVERSLEYMLDHSIDPRER
jgi:hypothetical protein